MFPSAVCLARRRVEGQTTYLGFIQRGLYIFITMGNTDSSAFMQFNSTDFWYGVACRNMVSRVLAGMNSERTQYRFFNGLGIQVTF